jgi:predicted nucleic acid-binding protein
VAENPEPSREPLGNDPGDEYLIALARTLRVDALVSGDPHLTRLHSAMPVLTPRQFLDSLSRL